SGDPRPTHGDRAPARALCRQREPAAVLPAPARGPAGQAREDRAAARAAAAARRALARGVRRGAGGGGDGQAAGAAAIFCRRGALLTRDDGAGCGEREEVTKGLQRVAPAVSEPEVPGSRRHRSAWKRACVVLPGLVVLALGTLVPDHTYARYLWPSGHITEVVYLTVLRAMLGVVGVAWAVFGALASRQSLVNAAVTIVATLVVLSGLEIGLRIKNSLEGVGGPTKPTGLRASPYPGLVYENTPNFHEFGEQKFNSLGLRDDERPLDPTRPKIVVVGDSI